VVRAPLRRLDGRLQRSAVDEVIDQELDRPLILAVAAGGAE
jgi:hypothetical protein